MLKPPFFEEITQSLTSLFPDASHAVKQQIKEIIMQAFSRLDLVTREEFDVQTKVLQRTREKLEALEKRLNEM